jgi:hypothetical protein
MMSDDDSFLARWSRRKLHPAPGAREQLPREKDGVAVASEASANPPADEINSTFDPQSLPPIESIGPGSDVRAFLAVGVPPELTRAALRRLWSSDPKIRDFVGLSENSWDFNSPGAMAGFGPMDKEQVRRVLTQLLGNPDIEAVAPRSTITREMETGPREPDPLEVLEVDQRSSGSTTVDRRMLGTAMATNDAPQPASTQVGSQHATDLPQHRSARRKGSALPK